MSADPEGAAGRRIIVHAGFHKTATSTIQSFLRTNGPVLWPHAALVLPNRLRSGAGRCARHFDDRRDSALLDGFAAELRALFAGLTLGRHRRLVLSDESLCGRMPGHPGVLGYEAAVALMRRLAGTVSDVYRDPDLVFCFTTRAPEAWLRSIWGHNIHTGKVTDDFADFAARHHPAADFDGLLAEIRAAVHPFPVVAAPLEASMGPFGPAGPLVDLLQLPAQAVAALVAVRAANIGAPADLVAEMLALNRSDLAGPELRQAKERLVRLRARGAADPGKG